MSRSGLHVLGAALFGALVVGGCFPAASEAHGPLTPVASSYVARVGSVPAGLEAKVVDGDQQMWLRATPRKTVVVLDYRGAPYLRFSSSGVEVNQNSAMYYLNQTPVAQPPPPSLTRATPPKWQRLTRGHDYRWHDGRLHALATVALPPGVAYVGRWSLPVLIDGRLGSIAGGVWHAQRPSIVWFWPIAVLLLCILAAWRVRQPRLDALVIRGVAVAALTAVAAAAIARGLHGRPGVSVLQLVELAVVLALVLWGLRRVLFASPGYFSFFVVAVLAVWEGIELLPTLLNGFVLVAAPAFVARAAAVVCLGCGAGLLLCAFRVADQPRRSPTGAPPQLADELDGEDDTAIESLV